MNLSKSKYCNGIQCKKMLWLDKYFPNEKDEVKNQSVLDNGTEVGILAKSLFGEYIDIEYSENLNQMVLDTKNNLLNDNIIITEASFVYNNNFCSIDILKKNNNKYEIYEVKSSTEIKDIYLDDISYQVYVMRKLGYDVVGASIVYINSNYERRGDLELDKLFIIEDVLDIVNGKQLFVEDKINEINKYMEQIVEPRDDIGYHCTKPYECLFFKYCTKHLPDKNVFDIRRMLTKTKFSLYHKGIISYEDLFKEDIDWKFKQQIEYELFDKAPTINKENIKKFLSTLSYPLYFLDFETFQQSIPKYDGVRPYMQIPFQYSLHYIEKEDGILKHKEFLAESNVDPRRKLAEHLVNDIPKNVCVVAYNMMFEKMVIKNLARMYPDLSIHLLNIYENMRDLMVPFKERDYYKKEMNGSYSIKYVLPALFPQDDSLDYHNLELIHNGSEAMSMYANLDNMTKDEQEKVRKSLLSYCELDTYAMVKIWEKLKEVV